MNLGPIKARRLYRLFPINGIIAILHRNIVFFVYISIHVFIPIYHMDLMSLNELRKYVFIYNIILFRKFRASDQF